MRYTLAQLREGTGFEPGAMFEQVKDYNGWTNRETWAVALYINNDQGWQESVYEALTALTDDEGESLAVKVAWTDWQIRQAGQAIRENVEEAFDPDTHECIFTRDTLMAMQDIGSLWRVDWDALGAAFLPDASES